mmetsp:Transcript_29002/g.56708  ORF Transcript_29002/g.56708 Transcript_29002/m.56708 type:complete len:303 (-) Transcript_29002:166-1074(-)|eukprot:CAMPEP_0173380076 /NCGR_PEP_ID=MMETSP1356-20130122/2844_1 /TAXON_ID=77927 ORGANISM="Hemiselmis virescens, Strain PCC157" /NCGR_SAMPLE_ID=MMETSP1356 /ASSEMBLY_ACC=CAM_ASM_000847 /LENGTH=302 /DNA_ID=CAMNT_0014333565 /DNA_START=82 /DNA_END=990 /DNA_ORIENTATION=-
MAHASGTVLMRIKSTTGESCYFKDDSGRFSSDINKSYTLKIKVQTAYKLTFECPRNLRVISVSIDGCPVPMEDAPGHGDKVLCVGIWRTDVHFATDVSKREKLEFVLVVQVDGFKGPDSDERHLLKQKILTKFYHPDYAKYTEKGHALGAVRFRCSITDKGGSKITGMSFADALHVEQLRKDEGGEEGGAEKNFVTVDHHRKQNTKKITLVEKEGEEGGDLDRRQSKGESLDGEGLGELLSLKSPTNSSAATPPAAAGSKLLESKEEEAPPAKEQTPPAKEQAPPAKEKSPPAKEKTPPAKS